MNNKQESTEPLPAERGSVTRSSVGPTTEISDGGPLTHNLKPQRNPAVRCIDLLGCRMEYSELTEEQQEQVAVQWSGYRVDNYLYEIGNDDRVMCRRRKPPEVRDGCDCETLKPMAPGSIPGSWM